MKVQGKLSVLDAIKGSFEKYETLPENPKLGQWALINDSVMTCISIDDVPAWVPITPVRDTEVKEQPTPSPVWTIPHSLDSESVLVQCYDLDGAVMIPDSIKTIDENTTEVTFPQAVAGKSIVMHGYESGVTASGVFAGIGGGNEIDWDARISCAKNNDITADASGYVFAYNGTSGRTEINGYVNGVKVADIYVDAATSRQTICFPVSKGDVFRVTVGTHTSLTGFFFVPIKESSGEGSKPSKVEIGTGVAGFGEGITLAESYKNFSEITVIVRGMVGEHRHVFEGRFTPDYCEIGDRICVVLRNPETLDHVIECWVDIQNETLLSLQGGSGAVWTSVTLDKVYGQK